MNSGATLMTKMIIWINLAKFSIPLMKNKNFIGGFNYEKQLELILEGLRDSIWRFS